MKSVSPRIPNRPAFTAGNLLALLATLAVLTTLVLVPLTRQQRARRLAQCLANLQQVNRAVLQFSEDHGKQLPGPIADMPGELQWWYKEQVKGYAGLKGASTVNDVLFACPDDRGYTEPKPFHQTARFDYGSYVFNGVILPGTPHIAGWAVSAIAEPRKTLLVMEWTAHGPLSWHRSRTGRQNAPFYRDAENVVGFVDGHVSLTKIYHDGYNAAYTRDPIPGYEYRYSGN